MGQTHVLEASPDYDHRTGALGEISALPLVYLSTEAGHLLGYRSVWKPSPEQLALLNAGGGVVFDVCAPDVYPIAADVCPAEFVLVEA